MKKESLKSKVLDAACHLVEKEGMAQLNVRKVAKKSQCALGSIYTVFDNFESLQLHVNAAVLSQLFDLLHQDVDNGFKEDKTMTAIFKDLGRTYIKFGNDNTHLWKSVFEHFNSDDIPLWYREKAQKGVYTICEKLSAHFDVPLSKVKHHVGFFWASIHGMSAIFLNKKMAMVAELFHEDSFDIYIDYCLKGLN